MKASRKTPQNDTYQSRPLSVEQRSGVDLLVTGATDAEVAAAVGVDRGTVWRWRHEHPDFISELEKARQQFMSGSVDKLRAALPKAVGNIVNAVEAGDLKASLALMKCVGLQNGDYFKPGETDANKIALGILLGKLATEQIPESSFDLSHLDRNPAYEQRKREILAELGGLGEEIA